MPESRSGITRFARRQMVGVLLAFLAGIGGFWWSTLDQAAPPIGVVIITLDTTRADRLPAYGFMDATMPHLDRLAREGVVFDQATSVAPLTLPAHASLFTGLFPPAHRVRDNADRPLSSEHSTLAETLKQQGFRTAAFVGSVVLDADRGLSQGFDDFRGVATANASEHLSGPPRRRRGDEVITDAIRWIDSVHDDSRFFVWAHLYDPHRPYDPPEPFRSQYSDPYVAEIAFADAQIGRLLEALDRRTLLNRTIVVVAADHGESLGDHGERDHGIFVYESVLRVPLIMRVPGVAPRRVADVVRLVDVMPTVLDLLGVPCPPINGASLVGMLHGKPQQVELEAYSESQYPLRFGWSPLRALRAGRYKLIEAPRPELYDLERDPFEERNLYEQRRDVARAFSQRLLTLDGSVLARRRDPGSDPIPASDLQHRLASLGYVGSGPYTTPATHHDLPDPKDCIDVVSGTPRPSCANTRPGSWPVPIGQLFVKGPPGSTR
ncbi:MAG: sulfatase [Vicinamibacterales bacterium]